MIYFYLGNDYPTETLYKSIINSDEIIIGLSSYHYGERVNIFSSIGTNIKVVEEDNLEDRLAILEKYKVSRIFLHDDDYILSNKDLQLSFLDFIKKQNIEMCDLKKSNKCINYCGNGYDVPERKSIRSILEDKGFLRVIESNSGLTSLLLNHLCYEDRKFDAFWASSLCDSLLRGKADREIVDIEDRLTSIRWSQEISDVPYIFDLDSGGRLEKYLHSLKTLYLNNVKSVVIEDKIGEKINSLSSNCVCQNQDSISNFTLKILKGKQLIKDPDFFLIARIESFILQKGIDDALERAKCYSEAGADCILIHYKDSDINLLKDFIIRYNKLQNRKYLAVIPTAYSYVYESFFRELGVNIVIYANQITRNIIPSVINTGISILKNERALESSKESLSVRDTLSIVSDYL